MESSTPGSGPARSSVVPWVSQNSRYATMQYSIFIQGVPLALLFLLDYLIRAL